MPWTPLILDKTQLKMPFWLTPVPDDLLPFFGHVTVLWGFYEDMFDQFLEAMVQNTGKEPGPGWKTRHYKARKALFKKQAKICFQNNERILGYISKMLTDSVPIHRERNILTHGRISEVPQSYYEDVLEATGYVKKKPVTIAVNQTMLVRLFHELGHLAGRMQYLHDPRDDEEEETLPLEQPERQILQDFWFHNRQIAASAKKPAPQPQAGRAKAASQT